MQTPPQVQTVDLAAAMAELEPETEVERLVPVMLVVVLEASKQVRESLVTSTSSGKRSVVWKRGCFC